MGKTSVQLLIFDLDGTLIEPKWDIAKSVNLTLAELGLPERPLEEIFGFVGDGVKKLLRLAVGEEGRSSFEDALKVSRGHYLAHCLDRTTFFPGIEPMLRHFAHKQKAVATTAPILGMVLLICLVITPSVDSGPWSLRPWSNRALEYWRYGLDPLLHHSIAFVLSSVSCFLSFTVCYLLITAYWFQTHRVVTVFSSMNIFMEASLD